MFKTKVIATLALMLTIASCFIFEVAPAKTAVIEQFGAGQATVYITPSDNQFLSPPTVVNNSFTVTVRIQDFTHVAGWQAKVVFVKEYLYTNTANVTYATDFIFPPVTYPMIPSIVGDYNATHSFAMMTTTTYYAVEYSGTDAGLMKIKFYIKKLPAEGEKFESLLWLEPDDTWTIDTNLEENAETLTDGHYQIEKLIEHDIAVIDISFYPLQLARGGTLHINVTVLNKGMYNETFALDTYANWTFIGSKIITLEKGTSMIVLFEWNTTNKPLGKYAISAFAHIVANETHTEDNALGIGWFFLIPLEGDINGDGKVDGKDIAIVAKAYNTKLGDPLWDPRADINGDGKVDGRDIAIVAKNYNT